MFKLQSHFSFFRVLVLILTVFFCLFVSFESKENSMELELKDYDPQEEQDKTFSEDVINLEEFISHFSDLLSDNNVFRQMGPKEQKAMLEKLFTKLDSNRSGTVELSEVNIFLSDTRSMDWKTMGLFNFGFMFIPAVVYHIFCLINSNPIDVYQWVLDVWVAKPQWKFTNGYPFKIAVWGILDTLKIPIKDMCGSQRFKYKMLCVWAVLMWFLMMAVLVVYILKVMIPEVIQKILDGESLTYALEETITIVEVLMTTFEFTYLASQLGLVFAANRTGEAVSLNVRNQLRELKHMKIKTSKNTYRSKEEFMSIPDIIRLFDRQRQAIMVGRTFPRYQNVLGYVGPFFMAMSGAVVRFVLGKHYFASGEWYDIFMVFGTQLALFSFFYMYFSLLRNETVNVLSARADMELFSALTVEHSQRWYDEVWETAREAQAASIEQAKNAPIKVNPRQDIENRAPQDENNEANPKPFLTSLSSQILVNVPPPPIYIQLNTPQNIRGWTRLRDFMKKKRLVQARQMEAIAGGLIGSEVIWILTILLVVVLETTKFIPGVLTSMQIKVFLMIILWGTISYVMAYGLWLLKCGVTINQLQMSHCNVVTDTKWDLSIDSAIVAERQENNKLKAFVDDSGRKRDSDSMAKEEVWLVIMQSHTLPVLDQLKDYIQNETDYFPLFGLKLTPGIFSTFGSAAATGLISFISLLGYS